MRAVLTPSMARLRAVACVLLANLAPASRNAQLNEHHISTLVLSPKINSVRPWRVRIMSCTGTAEDAEIARALASDVRTTVGGHAWSHIGERCGRQSYLARAAMVAAVRRPLPPVTERDDMYYSGVGIPSRTTYLI